MLKASVRSDCLKRMARRVTEIKDFAGTRILSINCFELIAGNNPEGGACMTSRFPVPPGEEVL